MKLNIRNKDLVLSDKFEAKLNAFYGRQRKRRRHRKVERKLNLENQLKVAKVGMMITIEIK